ncbi:hypothetical protein GCM10007878_23610 [Marinospirillum insulare]|uniref:FecR protein domain-containing protein n=2 Tax=Marinospirillum insulare TaxID=217169 RepID=A0ABQ6A407_9GAMM|nr:hypothetical protein GCM10007878_23610 [Marinospirillum insulare]
MLFVSLLLMLVYTSFAFAVECESYASLIRTEGKVQLVALGSPFPKRNLDLPYALCSGDRVQTVAEAQALISHSGGELVLAENSSLEMLDVDSLSLTEGTALFRVTKREGQRFVAKTPLVVIGVKGTEFLVSSQSSRNDVALFKGEVEVERQDGQEMAYYESKPVSAMSFSEYQAFQQQSFNEYKNNLEQAFSDYKEQQLAEFKAYVSGVDLQAGRQLTLSGENEKPEAIDAPINKSVEKLQQQLNSWLE